MICPKCGGGGKVGCTMCKGTGLYHEEDGITNEEWFCNLSTEEKARFIARYGIRRQVLHSFEKVGDSIRKSTDKHLGTNDIYEPIEEWLKQPHT